MQCADCGKNGVTFSSNATGGIHRCSDCDRLAEEKYGIKRELDLNIAKNAIKHYEFKPYELKDGPIYNLPDTWRGITQDKNSVRIESRSHEKSTLEAMNCHFGETGEKIRKHTFENKGNRTSRRIFSFVGRKGISTCQ